MKKLILKKRLEKLFYSRAETAKRWGCSVRKIDRLREIGVLPWLDLAAKTGKKPTVRIRLEDIRAFEINHMMSIKK